MDPGLDPVKLGTADGSSIVHDGRMNQPSFSAPRGYRVRTVITATLATAALIAFAGCGDTDNENSEGEARIARERADAARQARQEERLKTLKREVEQLKRRTSTDAAAAAGTPTVESARRDPGDPGSSEFAGRWRGQGTQYTPRGTRQNVSFLTNIDADGTGGTHSEYITGRRTDSDCRGTLRRIGAGRYVYTEIGNRTCISTTTILLTVTGPNSLRLTETYKTATAGGGTVEGTLYRVAATD